MNSNGHWIFQVLLGLVNIPPTSHSIIENDDRGITTSETLQGRRGGSRGQISLGPQGPRGPIAFDASRFVGPHKVTSSTFPKSILDLENFC